MDPELRLKELLQRLRGRGNRLTPQRVAIVKAVLAHDGHPTVEQIHRELLHAFPTTSLATVYKTMTLLKDAGEVLELGFGDLGSRFDGRKPYPHPHLICTGCGRIMDSEVQGFEEVVANLAKQENFLVKNHRFDIFGLCSACRPETLDAGAQG
jgi:Fur family transcriptional regulator, peroxide stress response regulator